MQDVQWNDLDYMNISNDFTYDKEKFKNLPEFVEELHKVRPELIVMDLKLGFILLVTWQQLANYQI
jgi:hypothetical protein